MERRSARVGTVSGLALLGGGTAVAAVAGGAHSIFATVLLGMLAVGMGHALLDEIRRQARRARTGWARHDTVNAVLLASWAAGALIATMFAVTPVPVRTVGLILSLGYAVSCAYFVVERRRTITGLEIVPEERPAATQPVIAAPPVIAAQPVLVSPPVIAARRVGPATDAPPVSLDAKVPAPADLAVIEKTAQP